jgi:hypothetical protein
MTDWIANPDNEAFHDFFDSARRAVMSVLLGTALVDNSSLQALRSFSMDVVSGWLMTCLVEISST